MTVEQKHLEDLLTKEIEQRLESAIRRLRAQHVNSLLTHEILNEGFLRAVHSFEGRWSSQAHFYGYLYNAIHSFLVDYARRRATEKRGARPCSIDLLVEHGQDPECSATRMPLIDCDELIESTPAEHREIVLALVYGQESGVATAERLALPYSRVKMVRRRFKQRLRALLSLDEDLG